MKNRNRSILVLGCTTALLLGAAVCFGATIEADVVNRGTQPVSFTQIVDLNGIKRASIQVIYATASPVADQFTSGAKAAINFTVSDWRQIQGRASSATVTVFSTGTNLSGFSITINGKEYLEGRDWSKGITSTASALALGTTLHAHTDYDAAVTSNVITLVAAATGSYANSFTLTTSSSPRLWVTRTLNADNNPSSAPWTNGRNPGYIFIAGRTLTEGTSFFASISSAVTAIAVHNAIRDDVYLSQIIKSTPATTSPTNRGAIYTTATLNGIEFMYPMSVSTGFAMSGPYMNSMSTPCNVSLSSDIIRQTNHGYNTGLALLYSTTSITGGADSNPTIGAIGGLTAKTTYFAIKVNNDEYKLAPTAVAASSGGAADLTSLPETAFAFNVVPIPFTANTSAGSALGAKWQYSNDGSNWIDYSGSSITSTGLQVSGTTAWDFGEYGYRFLRFSYTAPVFGANHIHGLLYGKDN